MLAVIVNAFDIEETAEILKGLVLSFAVAVLIHIVLLIYRLYSEKALACNKC